MTTPQRVAIVGVGYSTVGRRTNLTPQDLMIQSVTAALADAGMDRADVDGMTTMGGNILGDAAMMGIGPLNWFDQSNYGPAYVQAAVQAIGAIESGSCHTCIATRIITQHVFAPGGAVPAPTPTIGGDQQFVAPYGAGGPFWAAMRARQHMATYGLTEEQLGAHVVAQRHFATLNEDAIFRDPLTIEDYLSSRYICTPLRLLDCDYPFDAGSAVIFTTEERAYDYAKRPVFVESYALNASGEPNFERLENSSPTHSAAKLWSRTDLTPADVDCAQLYDGFSIITLEWLEALGFCGTGEAGSFVAEGHTAMGGSLPINTDGGACNVGRRHGANFCIEATRQLRGECGPRQVPDAEVAVWSNGAAIFSGAVLLTRG